MKYETIIPFFAAVATLVLACGCQPRPPAVAIDDPQMGTFVNVLMPRKIELQHYLTRPRSFSGSGDADGVEVIVAAKDAQGDDVKAVGTFNFELYSMRMASGDKFGKRFGFWSTRLDNEEALAKHWDRVTRFFTFKLELDEGRLPPGRYILTAELIPPTGDKLFDEYAFTHGAEGDVEKSDMKSAQRENKSSSRSRH